METQTFKILTWQSKFRTLKYLLTVVTFFYLNVVKGVSLTVLVLSIVYVRGVYQMLRNKCKGPTYQEKLRKEWKE